MKGTERYFDLVLGRLAGGHPLEPKTGFDKILHPLALPVSISKSNELIRETCNERNENHPRGYFIPK
jgi:hypothetical protein